MLTNLLAVHHCVLGETSGVLSGYQSHYACGMRFTLVALTLFGVQVSKHLLILEDTYCRQLCRPVILSRVEGLRVKTRILGVTSA